MLEFLIDTFITYSFIVIDDETNIESSAYVGFLHFIWGITIRENHIVKNTWKVVINPKFRLFTNRILAPRDDIHLFTFPTNVVHSLLGTFDWRQLRKISRLVKILNHFL